LRPDQEEVFMKNPRPNLKYVDADDLDDKTIKFDGLEVDSYKGEKLGKVEGFIIDVTTGRPYHVVVGSGGWFRHKHFLLPIGHVALSPNKDKLIADLTKDRVEHFPGFDKDVFEKLSEEDLKKMTDNLAAACAPDEVIAVEVSAWETAHYAYPTWWDADFYRPDRADRAGMDVAGTSGLAGAGATGIAGAGATGLPGAVIPPLSGTAASGRPREQMRASEGTGDTSPDAAGRAQPGDVLGTETGGERTYVGDTSEDEDKRRREAEEAARKR
jgi:sporulation protein YlmC with PRC-barrel domain